MSGLKSEYAENTNPELVLIGATQTPSDVTNFTAKYGAGVDQFWIDTQNVYRKLIEPGGYPYPIEVVIDRQGTIVYLATDYYPGEAMKAALDAL